MGNNVFANGREISCKAAAGKTICAMPDVCFTPPENPATPPGVPVPYPNTGMASDTTDGSKNVKIADKEVGLKNKSSFKKSTGDEAGSAAKKGVITSKNRGKVFFESWSMDVKIEGQNAVRHLDLTTNNHASTPGDTPTWPYIDRIAMSKVKPCANERKEVEGKCEVDEEGNVACPNASDYNAASQANDAAREALKVAEASGDAAAKALASSNKDTAQAAANESHMQYSRDIREDECNKAARCLLVPWDKTKCCKPQTPHHLVFKASFKSGGSSRTGCGGYNADNAPCICATGGASSGTHGLIHAKQKDQMVKRLGRLPNSDDSWSCGRAERVAAQAVHDTFPQCSRRCIQAQLRSVHQKMGVDANTDVGMVTAGASQDKLASLSAAFNS